jgi:hypothetical protein
MYDDHITFFLGVNGTNGLGPCLKEKTHDQRDPVVGKYYPAS